MSIMKQTSYSSSASRKSQSSKNSIRSSHSINEIIIEEEEEENDQSQTLLDNNDSISKLLQESMVRNKMQQENVQLKQQLLEVRKKFEDEKASLIQKEILIREENQKNNEFLECISKVVGISRSNPNFEKSVLAKLKFKQANNEEEEFNYDRETSNLKDKRIIELEIAVQEGQKLIHSIEQEIEKKVSENNQIQKVVDNQQKRIDELSSYVRQFMIACDTTDSPENAIRNVQDMKKKFQRIEAFSDTKRIDDLMRQFEERRASEYGKIYQQIEEQGNLIHNAIQSLQSERGNIDSNFNSMEIYQTLQNTNKLLADRMQQLRGKKIKYNKNNPSDLNDSTNQNSGNRSLSDNSMAELIDNTGERYDRKGLGPTLWIAKTREMLSLERQLMKTNQRLETANRNCQCLANENSNLYYHYTSQNARFPQKPLPATLL